jgi:UDP-glucuronate 4-epimerase
MSTPKVLVTGAAGFIGAHVAARLGALGHDVVGCDNFNDYYDPLLKKARVDRLLAPVGVHCEAVDVADAPSLSRLAAKCRPTHIIHLAAQAGVRHSIANPQAYVNSNLVGFANVLEVARNQEVAHMLYASSSSVYGACEKAPFHETQTTDKPVSLYAATKKANEVMAHAYSALYGMRCTGLRFFTVYGPWGRPDMAYFSFARKLSAGQPLPIFAKGELQRDFTYIDDIVEGVVQLTLTAQPKGADLAELFNIGNHSPVTVLEFVRILASLLGVAPQLDFQPMQRGDVPMTCADVSLLRARIGFEPSTPLAEGLELFVEWFKGWETTNRQ